MVITTKAILSSQPFFLVNPINKPPLNPMKKTLKFSPLKPKTQAALVPLQPLSTNLPSISSLLATAFALAKRNMVFSYENFKEPLVAVLHQMGKWVELYHSVLMVRVVLGWFPNMPWDKQPFSAIRDLCDPFLSFCRALVPPISTPGAGPIDFGCLLGFAVLGVLGTLLKGPAPSLS